MYQFKRTLHLDNSSYWKHDKTSVMTSHLRLFAFEPTYGELRIYVDPATWDRQTLYAFGCICGNRLWLSELKEAFAEIGISSDGITYNANSDGKEYMILNVDEFFIRDFEQKVSMIAL